VHLPVKTSEYATQLKMAAVLLSDVFRTARFFI